MVGGIMGTKMVSLELLFTEHGIMYPCYFQGTPGVMLTTYPGPETTRREMVDMIGGEISDQYEAICSTATMMGMGTDMVNEELDDIMDQLLEKIKGHENETPYKEFFEGLDENADDPEVIMPVAIFTITVQ